MSERDKSATEHEHVEAEDDDDEDGERGLEKEEGENSSLPPSTLSLTPSHSLTHSLFPSD